ncbi:MAG: hypothetical protein HY505_00915 [Candidatus Yanofskybacteria bacterium]|nr:hypothetical protein [Candidatus Yanofskybacteria bacterium]
MKQSILCVHRFDHKVQVEHCNTRRFQGWSDLRIFTYFLGRVLESIAEGSVTPDSIFIILTKDRDFIEDIRREWEEADAGARLDLEFSGNYISNGGLVVFICQIDCPNYGHGRADDLKCAFYKVNNFLSQTDKA